MWRSTSKKRKDWPMRAASVLVFLACAQLADGSCKGLIAGRDDEAGEAACEGQGFGEEQCKSQGCCIWDDGACFFCGDLEHDSGCGGDGQGYMKEAQNPCRHYQHMQCLLDVAQKTCMHDVYDEGDKLKLLAWGAAEGIWLCCCPEPYKACNTSVMSDVCFQALRDHLDEDQINSSAAMLKGLQRARGAMQRAGGPACSGWAPEEPLTLCGESESSSFVRSDLFCETLTWQWEELGDGDPDQFDLNGCVFEEEAQARDGDARKGDALSGVRPYALPQSGRDGGTVVVSSLACWHCGSVQTMLLGLVVPAVAGVGVKFL